MADESLSGLPLFDPTRPCPSAVIGRLRQPDASTSLAAATVDERVTAGAPGACRRSQWTGTVRSLRQQASKRLTEQLKDRPGMSEASAAPRAAAWSATCCAVTLARRSRRAGRSRPEEQAHAAALFDALFGLGRLQPLIDDPGVENIEITGCDLVHLVYADGRIEPVPRWRTATRS